MANSSPIELGQLYGGVQRTAGSPTITSVPGFEWLPLKPPPAQDVLDAERDQSRVLGIVIEGVAAGRS